mmetsp:Transcript_49840/g.131736  ORF Transcript_49840/g.131736 Transcript_49840/m.131736 type:complete len:332 (+) Transcript_49840:161-1156(+)
MNCNKRTDTSHACPAMHEWEMKRRTDHHRKRIESMKPTFDTRTPPATQPHLTLYGRDYAAKKKATTEAAFSDLKMIQSIAKTMTRPVTIPERQGPVSLNADYRKQQIQKIMKENHTLLQGIETVKPCMSTMEAINDHREKMRYVINASHTARKTGEYDEHIQHFKVQDKSLVEQQKHSTKLRIESLKMRRTEDGSPKPMGSSQSLPSLLAANQTAPAAGAGRGVGGSTGGRLGSLASASASTMRPRREPEHQPEEQRLAREPEEQQATQASPSEPPAAFVAERQQAVHHEQAAHQPEAADQEFTAEQMVAREPSADAQAAAAEAPGDDAAN